jgi:hypothetical protein
MSKFICSECGEIFNENEFATWSESRGEYWGAPCSEEMSGCPYCHSDAYEEAEKCEKCGEYYNKYDLTDGYCDDCIKSIITYELALVFLKQEDKLCDFVFKQIFKLPNCDCVTDELREEMQQIYFRRITDDRIRNCEDFLNSIKEYIMQDRNLKEEYLAFEAEEVEE